jgi:putative heme iron utilization protein
VTELRKDAAALPLPFLPDERIPHMLPPAPGADFPTPLAPLVDVPLTRRPSVAEEARTILAGSHIATLATVSHDGAPWASVVTYTLLGDGTPVFCLTRRALHGRNVVADPRVSVAVAAPPAEGADPSTAFRVTLAGVVHAPADGQLELARAAYEDSMPLAKLFANYGDFAYWLLRVERVRWVGGIGRAAFVDPTAYATSEPDPVAAYAAFAAEHLNGDHADAVLRMARTLAGHTDATDAVCLRVDRYGLDLGVTTPRGRTPARVGFELPLTAPDDLEPATIELARRAGAI